MGNTNYKARFLKTAEYILFAGCSALLLSLSYLYPELRFLTIFALVPFLWRLINSDLIESILLGVLLGSMFVVGASLSELWLSPSVFVVKFLGMSFIFALFAIGINRVKSYLGFNPVFIALLWLPFEYILRNSAHIGFIFTPGLADSRLLLGVGSIFGFLMISFFIILINASILIFLRQFRACKECRKNYSTKREPMFFTRGPDIFIEYIWYYSQIPRSPPREYIISIEFC